jgi:hypothetical protein
LRKPRVTHGGLLVVALVAALIGALVISGEGGSTSVRSGGSPASTAPRDMHLSAGGSIQPSSTTPEVRGPVPPQSRALPAASTGMRPTISSISQQGGGVAGGNELTIKGENFSSPQILFNSAPARILSGSPDAVTVIVPAQERPGIATIVVTNRDGSYAVARNAYKYGG